MESIYYIAILLLAGFVFSRVLALLKMPDVTGYLIGGIIIGPSVLGLIPRASLSSLEIISEVALAFIAFSIGSEMKLSNIRKLGTGILLVVIFEALFAFFAVTISMIVLFRTSFAFAITIGSIASATAPAATLMVIKQYNAKGPLVNILIPVVALDDVVCIMAFGIASSVAKSLISNTSLSMILMLLEPLKEILFALISGLSFGFIFSHAIKKTKNSGETIYLSVAFIFLATTISLYFKLSSLLVLMTMGITASNFGGQERKYNILLEKITPPIIVSFFVLSGAELDFMGLKKVGLMGVVYVISRVIGKMSGAYISSKIAKYPTSVQNYLGLALMPQAGVAIGLRLIASRIIPSPYGEMIRSIVLGATIVYELIGPLVAKFALLKSGCIDKGN